MQSYPFTKKPAFFPYMSAEVFFEASETVPVDAAKNDALDNELDKILGLNGGDHYCQWSPKAVAAD
jgi:hypothetical protein